MLKFAKFIGANTDFATAQAFIFPRVFIEGSPDPVFGLVISGEGEDVFVYIRQKILSLEESFNAPYERITDKLHELLETLKLEFKKIENLKITLFCAKDSLFYVLQSGSNLVEIWDGEHRLPILKADSAQEKIISGFIKDGNRILVLSTKAENVSWSDEVVNQVFALPVDSVDDAEVIFAKDEQAIEKEEDLAGVKNIQPVAFILIENQIAGAPKAVSQLPSSPKRDFRIKVDFSSIFLLGHKITRIGFGVIRRINRKLLIGIIILLLVSMVSLGGYWYWTSQQEAKNTRRDNLITLIEAGLNQAVSQKDLDQKSASEELKKAGERLKELEGLDPKNERVLATRKFFDEKSNEILKIYKDLPLDLFMSLDLIKSDFQTKRMSFSVDKILLLDEGEKSLVSVETGLKTPTILAGRQQLGDAKFASLNGSNAFSFSPDRGIVHVDLDSEKASVVSAPDAGWGQIQDIFGFADNVYALDSGKNMIWKYAPTGSGFSQKQEYLKGETNLAMAKRLIIDYSVWVLTGEPDILKFTAGNSDFYALSGLEEPLTQIDGIFVPEDLDNVFLLDKSKNRILVTKKNGEYLAQYISDQFSKVDDFFVNEEEKAFYLLIENKIFKTPLR